MLCSPTLLGFVVNRKVPSVPRLYEGRLYLLRTVRATHRPARLHGNATGARTGSDSARNLRANIGIATGRLRSFASPFLASVLVNRPVETIKKAASLPPFVNLSASLGSSISNTVAGILRGVHGVSRVLPHATDGVAAGRQRAGSKSEGEYSDNCSFHDILSSFDPFTNRGV